MSDQPGEVEDTERKAADPPTPPPPPEPPAPALHPSSPPPPPPPPPPIDRQPQDAQAPSDPQQQTPPAPTSSPPEFIKPLPDSMKQFRQPIPDGKTAIKTPRGLEPLITARQLAVKHDSEMVDARCKCYKNCHYEIYNERHQLIYYAVEDINVFSLCCMTKYRPYRMRIFDQLQYNCVLFRGTISFVYQQSTVEVPVTNLMGTIKKVSGPRSGKPYFDIVDGKGEIAFKITPIGDEVGKFEIFGADGQTKVGEISKEWSGFFREAFANQTDSFGISLPIDMDVSWKAVLLGALFFIDYVLFEGK